MLVYLERQRLRELAFLSRGVGLSSAMRMSQLDVPVYMPTPPPRESKSSRKDINRSRANKE